MECLVSAFNLTISVKEDISDECVKAVTKYLKKACKWYYIVLEQETSKRHLHACIFFPKPQDKKKLRENIWGRYVKEYHSTSIGKFAVHIQASPGRKWLDEYLKKEETVQVLENELPENLDDLEFPPQDIQEQLMKAKEEVADVFYLAHEVKYKEWLKEQVWVSSTETAHQYFLMRMFVRKDMRVICDSRRVHQMSVALHRYSTDSNKLTAKELLEHRKEVGEYSYEPPVALTTTGSTSDAFSAFRT